MGTGEAASHTAYSICASSHEWLSCLPASELCHTYSIWFQSPSRTCESSY